jgi:TonB-dependent starch-binding outer membrane protein SusC
LIIAFRNKRKPCIMNLKQLLTILVLPLLVLTAFGQDKQVAGKVTDAKNGAPIKGASVVVKGRGNGTETAADGSFSVKAAANAILVVSYVGYASVEVAVPASGNVNVALNSNADLGEVVVVGYGTQRKKDLTGSAVAVSSKDFQKGQFTTPEQLIAGKVAGVQITPNGGAPGAGSTIRIRGGSSLSASNDPLIIVDGIPLDNGGVSGTANILNTINPNDIESFTIMKDASATAIYGSRASNGVIIITTKKGAKGKATFAFSSNLSVQTPAKMVDVLSADEMRAFVLAQGNPSQIARLGTANTDWQNEIYQVAIASDNNLSGRGSFNLGKTTFPYRVSLGYLNQDGILKTGNLQRIAASANLAPTFLNNHLKVEINAKYTAIDTRFANEGAIGAAVAFDPTQPVLSANKNRFGGYWEWIDPATNQPNVLATRNPVGLLEQQRDFSKVNRLLGNLQLDYKFHFLPELRANLNLGIDQSKGDGTTYIPDSAAALYTRGGRNNYYQQEKKYQALEFYFNYLKDIAAIDSRVDVTAGYGYYDNVYTNFNYADYRANGQMMPGSQPIFPGSDPGYTLISYYGRLNYTFKGKYLLTATVRTDGSSRFSEDNRWGVFPSVALGWRVSDEAFLKGNKTINDLKLRASFGETGQQDGIDYYGYIPRYALSNNFAQYPFGSTYFNMYRPAGYDPNLKWETTEQLNVGFDLGLFKNRVTVAADFYIRKTRDLLNSIPVAAGTNFTNILLTNVGSLENRGFEVSVNTVPVKNNKLQWELGFNFTLNKNEITKLNVVNDPSSKGVPVGGISGGTGNTIQIHSVGSPTFSYFVYKQVYDQTTGKPIEGLYEDLNRDGVINEDDRYRYMSPNSKAFFGISSGVTYGKWNAGFVFRGSLDNYVYNNVASNNGVGRQILNPTGFLSNGHRDLYNTGFNNNQYFSDYYVQNASFIRLDNLNIGYNVGKILKGKANLRLNAVGQNLFVITKYKGIDPEVGGIDNNFYPRPRTFIFGLNLDF